ncbi:hypothetical protein J437_LFUL012601 [Ladona fulva]|uniref:Protein phosphatase 1 regulatory subunit 42 n=1 Tax=Ladona fulva TaxID=123851 RepID=A0A8K0P3T6_LADFU|nr:hypothetical protein J437_LFUL012601 [Ladona fulva]
MIPLKIFQLDSSPARNMVNLNNCLINKQFEQKKITTNRQRKNLSTTAVQKLTHLWFQNSNIHQIESISICGNLQVLYLQGNSISKIENLESAKNLTHLYLQDNKISKIENLETLRNLEKIFLSRNLISVVEGLVGLKQLRELHLEKQYLPSGEGLQFDPRSMESLSESLCLLNVSNDNLTSLCDLCPLKSLKELHATNNALENIKDVCESLKALSRLQVLHLSGNYISCLHKYKDMILVSAPSSLEYLDGKYVPEITKQFVHNLEKFKKCSSIPVLHPAAEGKVEHEENKKKGISDITLYTCLTNKNLTGNSNFLFPPWGSR